MKNIPLSLALLLLALAIGCKKTDNEPQMPAPTHDGRRVVAWKLDGKVYIAQGRIGFGDWAGDGFLGYETAPWSAYYIYLSGSYINEQSNTVNRVSVNIKCPFNHEINRPITFWNYPFRGRVSDMRNASSTIPTGSNEFLTDSLHRGTLVVTYEDSATISGTFKMDVVNDEGKVLHITDGMFDVPKQL